MYTECHGRELTTTLAFCPGDVHTQSELSSLCLDTLSWKQARPYRSGQKWWKINEEETEIDWVKRKLNHPEQLINICVSRMLRGMQIRMGMVVMMMKVLR